MKKISLLLSLSLLISLLSCSSGGEQKSGKTAVGTIKQTASTSVKKKKVVIKKEMPKAPDVKEETAASKSLGVGPITKEITLGDIDQGLVTKGETAFKTKCMVCHKFDAKLIGPALGCITKKQSATWIMNMIMAPDKMIKEDPEAKKLFEEFKTPMANMAIKEDEARAILEYLRSKC